MVRNSSTRCFLAVVLLACGPHLTLAVAPSPVPESENQATRETLCWSPVDIRLEAQAAHPWWEFPAEAEFTHKASSATIRLKLFWDGDQRWVIRFSPPVAGVWNYRTVSADAGLNGAEGAIIAQQASPAELHDNANLRGHLRVSASGNWFEYADGTPYLLLADTLWSGNTLRCGLGTEGDGPFHQYLEDRRAKGFTAVLIRYIAGFGDEPENPHGHQNEGGYPFPEQDRERLNARYFRELDRRIAAITDSGLTPITPIAWWGKTEGKMCPIEFDTALRLSKYLAVRYSAYQGIGCLSGEYQYAFRDCGWDTSHFERMGAAVTECDPYDHPLSIHPSSVLRWDPPHNRQSSIAFDDSRWLDHHWLQTGQSVDRMHNIVTRAKEVRSLPDSKPVFCSEGFYETKSDPEHAYHARWQMWTAMLNGCAGYGYGAWGIWQFYDPEAPRGETGKSTPESIPWRQALTLEGSGETRHVRDLLEQLEWWRLEPARNMLLRNGKPCPRPTARDLSPPQAAAISDSQYLLYIPRGNERNDIELTVADDSTFRLTWCNPRTGEQTPPIQIQRSQDRLQLPQRPAPQEDWVALLEAT